MRFGKDINSKQWNYHTIKRYSNVANELPNWAKEVLSSKMGNIEVSAKDSFEKYLMETHTTTPKYDYITFQKSFAETFTKRAIFTLMKIKDNREKGVDYYVSNNYFWQEFDGLFERSSAFESSKDIARAELAKDFWEKWNRFIRWSSNLWEAINRVGLKGLTSAKFALGLKGKAKEVKWK